MVAESASLAARPLSRTAILAGTGHNGRRAVDPNGTLFGRERNGGLGREEGLSGHSMLHCIISSLNPDCG
jgi:hypothetical protein